MRTWLLCLSLLAACPKDKTTTKPSQPETPTGPGTETKTGTETPTGTETLVTEGETYPLGDGVSVTILRIAMASASDDKGHDNHYVMMDVRIDGPDGQKPLTLYGGRPMEASGYLLTASELGFGWGASPPQATLIVARK